jgi:hypothetical protein
MSQDVFDENGHNISELQRHIEKQVSLGFKHHQENINKISDKIAVTHKIANKEELKNLVEKLLALPKEEPKISLEKGSWKIPEDQPKWGDTKIVFKKMQKMAQELDAAFSKMIENPVASTRLSKVDYEGELPGIAAGLYALQIILHDAQRPEYIGTKRTRVDWGIEAVKMCKDFWRREKQEEPVAYFYENNAKYPKNNFTCWFCDLMDKTTEMPSTKCKTFLED